MKFNTLVPELYVLDFQNSLVFYVQLLGFNIEYRREGPQFAFLSYQGSQLMIQQKDDNDKEWHTAIFEYPLGRGINFQIKTNNVQQLVDRLNNAGYPLKRELKDSWYQVNNSSYGYSQFLVMDPDGYLLRFSQPILGFNPDIEKVV